MMKDDVEARVIHTLVVAAYHHILHITIIELAASIRGIRLTLEIVSLNNTSEEMRHVLDPRHSIPQEKDTRLNKIFEQVMLFTYFLHICIKEFWMFHVFPRFPAKDIHLSY